MKNIRKKKQLKAAVAVFAILTAIIVVGTGPTIIADIAPPQSEMPEFFDNVTVYLNATDDISGVNRTIYWYDFVDEFGVSMSSIPAEYSGPIFLDEIGNYTMHYYSVDNAGNVEAEKVQEFAIVHLDTTPPVTVILFSGNLKEY